MGFPIEVDGVAAVEADRSVLARLLAAAAPGRIKRVQYTSGLWAYGDHGAEVVTEETPYTPMGLKLRSAER